MELEDPVFNALITYTKAWSVALAYRDLLTQLHSERVRGLSVAIGVACGLSKPQLNSLRIAASFHDIGKIGIPDHILLKPSQFDEAEWDRMKQHSVIGERILASTELPPPHRAALLIRHHHEHFNGMGYPDRLSGDNIPICSRIISIADSYDAMAVTRSYHHARSHPEIMAILHVESGNKHDPHLMNVFGNIIDSSRFKAPRA